jgi:ubiquinone/menaquinone biosynthesis C-methylase UbiE
MGELSLQSQIDAARAYESIMVPALFQEWTAPVLDAAEVQADQRVLDVACGTGVLARAASDRVGTGGAVLGLDPSQGMLWVAGELTSAVEWRSGTAEAAPFPDGSFDAAVFKKRNDPF